MRKIILFLILVIFAVTPAHAEDTYDPQHTMLALNMAIVSINRIISTQDRIVLDQEYNTIINKLALGNIESDYELTALYTELMNFITNKTLRHEEAKRFQERYNAREQRQLVESLSGIRAYGGNLFSWLGSLATSCVSTYFGYQTAKAELREGLDDELWQLKKEDIQDCNDLQVRLLQSSWNLLRQYKLPDEYRLTQDSLNGFFSAVNEPDPTKRLRMLKARNVERNFRAYPPYWYYRAKAAQESNDEGEALKSYEEFNKIWRPILRQDPYKLEAEKFRVQLLAKEANPDTTEIKKHLDVILDYIPDGDWSNNIFAGVAYFLIGDKDEGIACVEPNVDFGFEKEFSGIILNEMKAGKLDAFTLFALKDDLKAAIEKAQTKQTTPKPSEVKTPEPSKEEKEEKQTSSKRRALTKEEIIRITTKYGYTVMDSEDVAELRFDYKEDGVTKIAEPYTSNTSSGSRQSFFTGLTFGLKKSRYVIFYSHGIVTMVGGLFAVFSLSDPDVSFLSYDDLRNMPEITYANLKEYYDGFDDNFFKALMELKELE